MKEEFITAKFLISIIGVSILIFTLNSIGTFDGIRSFFSLTFERYYIATREYFSGVNQYFYVFQNISDVRSENEKLKSQVADLENEINLLSVQLKDVSYILETGLTEFDSEAELIPVRVLNYDQNETGVVYINKGSESNIDEDDVVVFGRFAVGKVDEVFPDYTKVDLILTDSFEINAIAIRTETRGIFSGSLPSNFMVQDVLNEEPLSDDDLFVTEGVDGIFPYGLFLGRVERVIGNPANPTKSALLQNTLDFRNLDRLYVMKYK